MPGIIGQTRKGEKMETTAEKLPPYTKEQIEEIAVREASKMIPSLQMYETKYHRIEEHLEDLAGAWVIGALEATKKIDPANEKSGGRGYQFASGRGIMLNRLNEIKAELSCEDISLYQIIGGGEEDGEEGTLLETIEDTKSDNPETALFDKIDQERAYALLDRLTEQQMTVMVSRFVDDKTQEEVAKEMGLTTGRVCQIESEARGIMRRGWAA